MINDPILINEIIHQIEALSFEDLNSAMKIVDQYFSNEIELTVSYIRENNYTFSENLNTYNNIYIKTKKGFFDFFKKDNQNNQDNLEAA